MQDLDAIVKDALAVFAGINDADELEQTKARYLGKTGVLTEQLKGLGKLPAADRPAMGARINAAKDVLEQALGARREHLQNVKLEAKLKEESLDVTLPGRGNGFGGLHPVSRTLERVEQIFHSLGFEVADGPEIETDFYNFTALNQPENHPARSMHDTFYLQSENAGGKHLLRTHTSPIQVRYMESHQPPISSQPSPKLISISAEGSVNGKNEGRKRTCKSLRSKNSWKNSVTTPFRFANEMRSSIHSPSTW